ncbi:MAG: protein kinase domain-containing protein [Candidatus Aminicenantales bacterium]
MKCPCCLFETPEDAEVCGRCGTPRRVPEGALNPGNATTFTYSSGVLSDGVLFAGRYLVIDEIGKGGMGSVYRVHDTKVGEEVALKFINPEIAVDKKAVERFRSELRITRRITHLNVCRMYDLSEEGASLFITMEYIPGEDLGNMIRRLGQLPVEKGFDIAQQVCEGLAEVHRLGVVHRDLKPKNLMIDREGNVKIMDFGLARTEQGVRLTEVGHAVGTPCYMSPEQLNCETVDQRSDIFALGVTMYLMLTGVLPFKAESTLTLALEHKTHRPVNPHALNARIPDDLGRIILRCLEIDKTARYSSAQELLADLQRTGRRFENYEFQVPKKGPRHISRARIAAAGAIILALTVSGFGIRALLKRPRAAVPPAPVVHVAAPVEPENKPEVVKSVPVAFMTLPEGAVIIVDGKSLGTSNVTYSLSPGSHTVKITKPGYRELTTDLTVEAAGAWPLKQEYRLVPQTPELGTLEVTSDPQEAEVFLDNSEAPAGRTRLVKRLPGGRVLVTVRMAGYQDRMDEVEVRAGQKSLLHSLLKPLDGAGEVSSDPVGVEAEDLGRTEPAALKYFLKITSEPPGASITLNGVLQKETTPFIWELDAHEVRIKIEKAEYESEEATVFIRPMPARNKQNFKLKKIGSLLSTAAASSPPRTTNRLADERRGQARLDPSPVNGHPPLAVLH